MPQPLNVEPLLAMALRPTVAPFGTLALGLIRFGGRFDYAACLTVNIASNSAGLT
jgi:hypothetical protein